MTVRSILQHVHKASRWTICPAGQSTSSKEHKTPSLGKAFRERFVDNRMTGHGVLRFYGDEQESRKYKRATYQ